MNIRHRILSKAIFLCAPLFIISFITAENITLSSAEYEEIKKNSKAAYVCLHSSLSDIKKFIIVVSKLDKDKQSPLHEFKRYVRKGFNIALYDEVVHALEYAQLIVKKKISEQENRKIRAIAKNLEKLINKVVNNSLDYDVHAHNVVVLDS